MSIPLAKIPARLLPRAAAWTLATILAACGGGGGGGGEYHPPPPPPEPTYTTYDVVPLTLPGSTASGIVRNTAITPDGMVAGGLDMQDGSRHAFLYDGAKMKDLGTMGGVSSEATGLNQSGQVVGWVTFSNYLRAFVYDSSMHQLGTTFGGDDSAAFGINERGQVAGFATNYSGVRHAFAYADGKMAPVRGDGTFSSGWAINAGGAVAGDFRVDDAGLVHAFLAGACQCAHDLGTLGGARSQAYGLNDIGEVAGTSDTSAGQSHAFVVRAGLMQDLGTFGGAESFAAAINQAGQIAGYADDTSGNSVAFLHDSKGLHALGNLGGAVSRAAALNATGQVVGFATTATGDNHAFVWTAEDGMVDLNTRLRGAPAGLVLEGAAAIAENGSIVANANTGLVLLKIHPRP